MSGNGQGNDMRTPSRARVKIVGPCAAGKTALERKLRALGYDARSCAQEHSYAPHMWRTLSKPDVLIYLDAQLAAIARRRHIDFGEEYLVTLRLRLRDARARCDLYLPTDHLSESEVLRRVLDFLRNQAAI